MANPNPTPRPENLIPTEKGNKRAAKPEHTHGKNRTIRVPDAEWAAIKDAAGRGNVSAFIREAVAEKIEFNKTKYDYWEESPPKTNIHGSIF